MAIFQRNRRRAHKFIMSAALFGFCMSRIVFCVLRIVWAAHPKNPRLAIAASIFANVGVLIVYVVVLQLALRVLRATYPALGWSKGLNKALKAHFALLFLAIVLIICFVVTSFYTQNPGLKTLALWVQRVGLLYILLFNLITPAMVILSALRYRSRRVPVPKNFGTGSLQAKLIVLGVATFFILFISGFRMGTIWAARRPASHPGWYDTKTAYYFLEFALEIALLYWLVLTRIDRRFFVPNGTTAPSNDAGTRTKETGMVPVDSGTRLMDGQNGTNEGRRPEVV